MDRVETTEQPEMLQDAPGVERRLGGGDEEGCARPLERLEGALDFRIDRVLEHPGATEAVAV